MLGLAVFLVLLWAVLWLGFHIAVGAIHLLLVLAVIMILWRIIRGNRGSRRPL